MQATRWKMVLLVAAAVSAVVLAVCASDRLWPRSEALDLVLQPTISGKDADAALVAQAIIGNFHEVRADAGRWSALYWGCTFVAAALGALAALVLKLDSLSGLLGDRRNDLAAVMSFAAALMVTLSTSGDFRQKWQANRWAAARLENAGYLLVSRGDTDPRKFLAEVAAILQERNLAIIGTGPVVPRPNGNAGSTSEPVHPSSSPTSSAAAGA